MSTKTQPLKPETSVSSAPLLDTARTAELTHRTDVGDGDPSPEASEEEMVGKAVETMKQYQTDFIDTISKMASWDFLLSFRNGTDGNIYYLNLNNQSNAISATIWFLILAVFYFFIIYLVSFMYLPIAKILPQEWGMFLNMMYGNPMNQNPLSSSSSVQGFGNMTDYLPDTRPYRNYLSEIVDKKTRGFQEWLNRFYLRFYTKRNAVFSIQKMNRRTLSDIKI